MNRADLAQRIPRIVAQPRWGGGLHEGDLQKILGCDRADLKVALMICYRRGHVDFCWRYVVVPVLLAVSQRRAA